MNTRHSKSQGRGGQPPREMGANQDDMDISSEDSLNQQRNVSSGFHHVPVGSQQQGRHEAMARNAHHGQFRTGNRSHDGMDREYQRQHEYENAPMDTDMGNGQQHVGGGIIRPEQIGGRNQQSRQMGGGNFQQEYMDGGNQQSRQMGGGNFQQEHMGGGNQQSRQMGGGSFQQEYMGGGNQQSRQMGRGNFQQEYMGGGNLQSRQMGGGNFQQEYMGGENLQSRQMGGGNLQQEQMGGRNQQNRSVGGGNFQQELVGGGNQQSWSVGGGNIKIPQTHHTSAAFEDDQRQMIYKQQQQQLQKMRSLQASKQMIFGTFENIIGDLEELEGREKVPKQKKPVKKSNIKIPDQSKKKNSDVESIVEVQLRIFQTHLKACPKEIREEVRVDMINKTLNWCADREENRRPQTKTDVYAAKLYELLQTGQTSHSEDFQNPPQINEAEMKEAVSAIMVGQHQQRDLDESFKADPEKKAAMKTIRGGEAMDSGIRRIQTTRPDLGQSLQMYMENSLR